MQHRTVATLPVILAIAVFLRPALLAAQRADAPPSHEATKEYYAPSVTPAIYLINFLFLYMANPDVAANMPAYKAPIPLPIVDCLMQNPTGCPYTAFSRCFEQQALGGGENRECFWPSVCQTAARWESLAPRRFRQPEEINEPLGRMRADQIAHLLGMDEGMIMTEAQYQCMIGTAPRTNAQQTIFRCIYNLTNSKGNAVIPLSSYGLNINEQGDIRSICAPDSPCLNFNALLAGPLEEIAIQCGFLEKLLRMETETPFRQLLADADPCQKSGEPACLIETTCAGKSPEKSSSSGSGKSR